MKARKMSHPSEEKKRNRIEKEEREMTSQTPYSWKILESCPSMPPFYMCISKISLFLNPPESLSGPLHELSSYIIKETSSYYIKVTSSSFVRDK